MTTTTLINAIRGELIGQHVRTQLIRTPLYTEGPFGVIRDETKQTLTIETGNGTMKRIIKSEYNIFLNQANGTGTIEVRGSAIRLRGEDRISMKVTP